MTRKDPSEKLPLPGPWQPPVRRALAHLAGSLSVAPPAVTVTRVQEAEWSRDPDGKGLEIWLMSGGRTYRYRAGLSPDNPLVEPAGE